jgi:hypothetical protein
MKKSESDNQSEADAMAELADMYRQADNLQKRQKQQNQEGGSAQNQAEIARDTAELQKNVLESSPEAARNLGRAAARMAEALDTDLSEKERSDKEAQASAQLASAVKAIQTEGRERRNEQSGAGGGLQSIDDVELSDDILGPSELSPAERAAIESARRQPVSPEYVPLVESYYEKLSKQSGSSDDL